MKREQIGHLFKRLRLEKNISQESLSHDLGVSTKTVSRFENGHKDGVTYPMIIDMMIYFNVGRLVVRERKNINVIFVNNNQQKGETNE